MWVRFIAGLILVVLISAGFYWLFLDSLSDESTLYPRARAIQDFSLTKHDDSIFTKEQLKDHWTLLFFGYTYCPDICPMALSILRGVTMELEQQYPQLAADTQVVFVSVDGARDTPELLSQYVQYFHPKFIGLSGDESQINALTRQLNIVYMKMPVQADGSYIINHSSTILLIDSQAQLVGRFTTPHDVNEITKLYVDMRNTLEER